MRFQDFACVFWDYEKGDWSTDGCDKVLKPPSSSNASTILTCSCRHATNFAVLMSFSPKYEYSLALSVISTIGCALSVAGLVITVLFQILTRWTVRDDSSSAAAQCSVGHPLVLSQWSQDAAHGTLPTGRCPTGHCPTGHCSQDAAHRTLPQDTAYRTLPTGRCPTGRCPTGRCWLDSFGWWTILNPAVTLRKSRGVSPTLLMVSICTCMTFYYLLFIFGINNQAGESAASERSESNIIPASSYYVKPDPGPCTVITVLLQYFLLAAFTWSTLYAAHIAYLIKNAISGPPRNFCTFSVIIGWGSRERAEHTAPRGLKVNEEDAVLPILTTWFWPVKKFRITNQHKEQFRPRSRP
ncbi:hypothetical protein NFI96_003969 [Prochilodus magdalenae]|nr:hypothetical protein NFI96_003969 [Prochilodus magdalenae]